MLLHEMLVDALVSDYGERLLAVPQLNHDALEVRFDTGLILQIRYPNLDEYALDWEFGGRRLQLDTAPLHHGLASFPNHLHDRDGRVVADPFTQTGRPAWENLHPLIARLLDDPWLEAS